MALFNPTDAFKGIVGDFRAWFSTNDYTRDDVLGLYALSYVIYACCNVRAENVAAVPMRVVDLNHKPVADHPANKLFQSRWNYRDAITRSEITLCLQGTNLLVPQTNVFGDFNLYGQNLRWVNPRLWSRQVTINEGLTGFRISTEGFLPISEAIYLQGVDLRDDFDGVAPAEVAYYAAGGQVEQWQMIHSFMLNRAIPAAIIQPTEDGKGALASNPDAPKNLRQLLERLYKGSSNAGRTLVSPDRLEVLTMQPDLEKMSLGQLSEDARLAITIAMQVPNELVNFSGATFSNASEAVQFWYHHWLKPRCDWYADHFSQFFTRWYGELVLIEPDFTDIIQEDDDTDRINSQLSAGYRDLYSAQVDAGFTPDERLRGVYMWNGTPTKIETLIAPKPPPLTLVQPPQAPPALPALASAHVPDAIYNEIEIAARKGAAFVAVELPAHTDAYIKALTAAGIERKEIVVAAKVFYLSVTAAKAIAATRLNFETTFEDLLDSALKDEVTRKRFRSILAGEIERYAQIAYRDGLIDGGIADGVLDEDDQAAVDAFIKEQRAYVISFRDTLFDDGVSNDTAALKPAIWWTGSIYPMYVKGLASAAKNAYYRWEMNPAKENCRSCIALDGQIHRMGDYVKAELYPGSNKLDCGPGKLCGCKFTPAPGAKAEGRFPLAAKAHDHELDEVQHASA